MVIYSEMLVATLQKQGFRPSKCNLNTNMNSYYRRRVQVRKYLLDTAKSDKLLLLINP